MQLIRVLSFYCSLLETGRENTQTHTQGNKDFFHFVSCIVIRVGACKEAQRGNRGSQADIWPLNYSIGGLKCAKIAPTPSHHYQPVARPLQDSACFAFIRIRLHISVTTLFALLSHLLSIKKSGSSSPGIFAQRSSTH